MYRALAPVFLWFAFAAVSSAQVPFSGNAFVGYSFNNTSFSEATSSANLNGWAASLDANVLPWGLGLVADFDGHYGPADFVAPGTICTHDMARAKLCSTLNANAHVFDALFGPRIAASFHDGKYQFFPVTEFGLTNLNTDRAGSGTAFSVAVGTGFDARISRVVAWRVEGDFVSNRLFGQYVGSLRISTGIVLRFRSH